MSSDGDRRAPRPVPGLVPQLTTVVTDEERNRYGVLLDHAAERGLLSPAEYEVRLIELAEATSEDELRRIVTELPVFDPAAAPSAQGGVVAGPAGRDPARPVGVEAALWAARTPVVPRKRHSNPWMVLAIVVLVTVVALIGLGLVAAHLVHTNHAGQAIVPDVVSRLRL